MKSGSLDFWRNYFRSANSDIFDIIDHAILVAASDCPKEFRSRRNRIAERLFSCQLIRCSGCDRAELAAPRDGLDEEDNGGCKSVFERDVCEGRSRESKLNSSIDNHGVMNMNQISKFSYGDAEALTDEIEEESPVVGEVLRIKEILYNSQEETDSVLFESLRKLQLMGLTVETLEVTKIGKALKGLRKHRSKEIRHLVRTIIDGWKAMVDEWMDSTKAVAEGGSPDSVNPSVVDDEDGLPSPPLDEGAFFATQPSSMELSQFFDGMDDDDGDPRNNEKFNKNREYGRRPLLEKQNTIIQKQQIPSEANMLAKGSKDRLMKKPEAVVKPNNPSNTESGPGRPPKLNVERNEKVDNETNLQQKSDRVAIQKTPSTSQQNKLKCWDEVSVQEKLEASKRKFQERYQQVENAKKQRTIQVVELRDLPKQGLGLRNPHMRSGNHNRHLANGRH